MFFYRVFIGRNKHVHIAYNNIVSFRSRHWIRDFDWETSISNINFLTGRIVIWSTSTCKEIHFRTLNGCQFITYTISTISLVDVIIAFRIDSQESTLIEQLYHFISDLDFCSVQFFRIGSCEINTGRDSHVILQVYLRTYIKSFQINLRQIIILPRVFVISLEIQVKTFTPHYIVQCSNFIIG